MNNDQVIEAELDLIAEQLDLDAFEHELIEEYGSLEAAILDMSDRPY